MIGSRGRIFFATLRLRCSVDVDLRNFQLGQALLRRVKDVAVFFRSVSLADGCVTRERFWKESSSTNATRFQGGRTRRTGPCESILRVNNAVIISDEIGFATRKGIFVGPVYTIYGLEKVILP